MTAEQVCLKNVTYLKRSHMFPSFGECVGNGALKGRLHLKNLEAESIIKQYV